MTAQAASQGAPTMAAATPEQVESGIARLAESGFSAFSKLFLLCFPPEQATVLEGAGRVLFARVAPEVVRSSAPADARQARRRFLAALEELRALATVLDHGALAKTRLAKGDLEAAYFEHTSALLARDLEALAEARLAMRSPTRGDLEAFAAAFPADSATYLVYRAGGALRSATSALEAAAARYEGLLLGATEPEGLPGRLLAALTLRRVLADYLRPAVSLLAELDQPGALPPAVGWAAGPWLALDGAARQTSDLAERLLAAFESIAEDELGTEAGAGLALALSRAIDVLQGASRETSAARDAWQRPALGGFPRSKRLALRLAGMARLAGGWQEELHSVADQLDLERAEAGIEPDFALRAWLEGQADGALAEVAATLFRLATGVPPDPHLRADQVS